MSKKLQNMKYTFTVEGETEKWYLEWLRDQINACPDRICNVSIDPKVQQSPAKFYKTTTKKATPEVVHICDVESNEPYHVEKFQSILSEMKDAKTNKKITYNLGYSNYTFELWMVLHKRDCNGPLGHRSQYLAPINRAYDGDFRNLEEFKKEDNFKRCLSKLTLDDVKKAIERADVIMKNNELDGKTLMQYKGYKYYRDNPAISIHDELRKVLEDCGILKKKRARKIE